MPRLHAFELVPDDAGRAAVLRDWQALRDAGLPSQADHRGPTNAPHVTVLEAPRLPADGRAAALLAPLLPVRARAGGIVVLGGAVVTLARAVELDDAVVAAVLELRRGVSGGSHRGWLPHVTLARRLRRTAVGSALDALDRAAVEPVPLGLSLVALRRWDPDAGAVTTVAHAFGTRNSDRQN